MNMSQLRQLAEDNKIDQVHFIESGCGPMVLEFSYQHEKSPHQELLKTNDGKVITCKNLGQAYHICRNVGLHQAELIQVIPHDEACAADFQTYAKQSIPLKF